MTQLLHGFALEREQEIPELSATARIYRHAKTGGRLLSLISPDENKVFGVAFLFSLVAAFAFAWFVGPQPELRKALLCGLVAGFGMVAASFGINYQFAQRSGKLWAIDGGYHTAQFALFGLILGLWH